MVMLSLYNEVYEIISKKYRHVVIAKYNALVKDLKLFLVVDNNFRNAYIFDISKFCRGGGIGRRAGLKIRWG